MENETEKSAFWESAFIEKQEMWGFEPSKSAVLTKDFFVQKSVKSILIPGIGYGRNARIFKENGIAVTGIEISKTAIEMARKHYGTDMVIYHGSVTDMPFDNYQYDGIFCYALIHLLDSSEREKLIRDCYNQLSENGYMVFTVISKEAHTYGQGKFISKDRYEIFDGVSMFFYDRESIHMEFEQAGLFEITEISENQPFFLIKCKRRRLYSCKSGGSGSAKNEPVNTRKVNLVIIADAFQNTCAQLDDTSVQKSISQPGKEYNAAGLGNSGSIDYSSGCPVVFSGPNLAHLRASKSPTNAIKHGNART